MRILILRDKKIDEEQLQTVLSEFTEIFENSADITPDIVIEPTSFKNIEGEHRYNFDSLPYGYVRDKVNAVHKKDKGRYDHIVFLVHQVNWIYQEKRVWGENFSNFFHDYHVEIVRFDNKNLANSVGTLWHEFHHPLDALVETELGIKVEPMVGVKSWDADITHGGRDSGANNKWSYIRHKENQESLEYIAPLVRRAYNARLKRYLRTKISMLTNIVDLLKEVNRLKRVLLNKHTTKCQSQ